MVKVGILGAETPMAGEIIRILINHPETEIVSLYSPANKGRNVSTLHHGLIGEQQLYFTDTIHIEDLDFLIVTEFSDLASTIISNMNQYENLKMVVLPSVISKDSVKEIEIGLSEINRKALVRGCNLARIPSPALVPALIGLIPLAYFLLLNSDIDIEMTLPADISQSLDEKEEAMLLEEIIKQKQASFQGKVTLKLIGDYQNERTSTTSIKIQNSLSLEEIENVYDKIYDDHNFTFISRLNVGPKEVEGSHKTVINMGKNDASTLNLDIFADSRLRGGAGDAVHVMNLFFGLHEKTGLNLKASGF